jgi:CheY-like chemotaxis protein
MSTQILVVDDEQPVAFMLKAVFETNGYSVVSAASAAEAVTTLAAQRFDAVITDMKMESDSAGLDVVRAARALANPPAVLILTAFPILARDWRASGADALLSKPSNITQLLDTVAELVSQRRRRATRLS